MRFANPKAAAAYAAQPAATPKPMPSIGGPRQAVMPGGGPSMIRPPIIAGNPRGNNMERMPSSGGMEQKPMPGTVDRKPMPGTVDRKPMPGGMKKGGKVSSASKRADGIAQRGKTRA